MIEIIFKIVRNFLNKIGVWCEISMLIFRTKVELFISFVILLDSIFCLFKVLTSLCKLVLIVDNVIVTF